MAFTVFRTAIPAPAAMIATSQCTLTMQNMRQKISLLDCGCSYSCCSRTCLRANVSCSAIARQSPLYFDLTLSLSKSVSIFHASLGENARLAREAGDQAGNAYWSGLVTEVDDMIGQATWAGFGYFQREAGYTRTGSHSRRVHGRETGQWHEADLAVAHWLQHTSRPGDMQLHVHSQIAHTARTTTDGKWRAPDPLGYNEHLRGCGDRGPAPGGGTHAPVRRAVDGAR